MERPNGYITNEPRIEFFSNDLLLEYSPNADIINQPENFNSDVTLNCSTNPPISFSFEELNISDIALSYQNTEKTYMVNNNNVALNECCSVTDSDNTENNGHNNIYKVNDNIIDNIESYENIIKNVEQLCEAHSSEDNFVYNSDDFDYQNLEKNNMICNNNNVVHGKCFVSLCIVIRKIEMQWILTRIQNSVHISHISLSLSFFTDNPTYSVDNSDDADKDSDYCYSEDSENSDEENDTDKENDVQQRSAESNNTTQTSLETSLNVSGQKICDDVNLRVECSKPKGTGKQNFCYYCKKMQSKISRHLEQVHKNEEEVKKFASSPKGKKEHVLYIFKKTYIFIMITIMTY